AEIQLRNGGGCAKTDVTRGIDYQSPRRMNTVIDSEQTIVRRKCANREKILACAIADLNAGARRAIIHDVQQLPRARRPDAHVSRSWKRVGLCRKHVVFRSYGRH